MLAGQRAQIDTATAAGRLVFGIFAALAEFERELIRERTVAGLKAARARGRRCPNCAANSAKRVPAQRRGLPVQEPKSVTGLISRKPRPSRKQPRAGLAGRRRAGRVDGRRHPLRTCIRTIPAAELASVSHTRHVPPAG